jgi:outer membrane protein OmpA-like peptidoglycan-associated protein
MRPVTRLGAAVVLAALTGAGSPARAQDPLTLDLGAFYRVTVVDDDVSLPEALGYGGRVGIFFFRNLAVEFEAARSTTMKDTDVKLQPYYARLAYHAPIADKWTLIIGAGWVHDRTNPAGPPGSYGDDGVSGLLGIQRAMSDRFAFRMDAVGDLLMSPIYETAGNDLKTGNVAVQAGLNLRLGKVRPRDGDNDGVMDRVDACVGTPAGDAVDARGCSLPKDADRDGIIDANDRCVSTLAGTRVDSNGCPVDSDGDGVLEAVDECANTPAGTRVDGRGCPAPGDTDRDGVLDNVDACPNTPAFTRVDSRGCPVPVDTDGDGVLDSADNCANTPAGTRVDGRGCPLPTDSDSDGVMDPADACPGTAAGVRVDARGCAIVFEEGRTNIVLEGVTFASGSTTLSAGAKVVLDRVALQLVNAPNVNVEVQGHTDNTGSPATNTRLSGLRAEAVRAYLIEKGVAAARLTSRGYGPEQPIAPNTTPSGRAQNRRVELKRTN